MTLRYRNTWHHSVFRKSIRGCYVLALLIAVCVGSWVWLGLIVYLRGLRKLRLSTAEVRCVCYIEKAK